MGKKFIFFFLLVIATLGAAYFFQSLDVKDGLGKLDTPKQTVVGDIGGEKSGFFSDPDVLKIFEKNGVSLDVKKEGSITMVTNPTVGKDFLSPSTNLAVDIFAGNGGSFVDHETVFYSPIVIYSWKSLLPVFQKIGIIEKKSDHYTVKLKKLQDHILESKKLSDLGVLGDDRYVKVYSTDPTKSNSGNMFSGLNYTILKEKFPQKSEREVFELLAKFFDKMGFMPGSSGDIFKNFLNKGESIMMVVGYENQLIEFYHEHPQYQQYIKDNIVMLYPDPTVWSEHEIIALNQKGKQIIEIFETEKQLQQIASKKHGFRIIGGQIEGEVELENIPESIKNIIPLPSYKQVERMLNFLQARNN